MEDETKAKSNLCKVFSRASDQQKSKFFGCGCVVKSSDQNLKISTSQKILSFKSTDVEIFAKFEDQDLEIKLQFPTGEEEESFEEVEGIAYLPLDDTATSAQLPDGFVKAEIEDVDAIACFVPVLENFEGFGDEKGDFLFYEVVRDAQKCSLKKNLGSNKRSFESKREFQSHHLEVLGSPILSQDAKFLGIVDFLRVANKGLLRIIYDDGVQKNFVTGGRSSQHETVVAQETDSGLYKLSPGDSLANLWNRSIDFRDEFCKMLNVEYLQSGVKYWRHLAEEFGIDKTTYDTFSTSDVSPTETLFEHLDTTEPDFDIGELCKSLENADAQEVSLILKERVEAGELHKEDLVTEICDKAPKAWDAIMLKLDREDRLWTNLARERGILKEKYSSFKSSRDNPTRLLFDRLETEGPELSIKNFKDKLIKLDKNNLIKILNKFKIRDEMALRDLSEYPEAKSEIERILNRTDDPWKLAELYKKEDGLMKGLKIEMTFRKKENCHSPTYEMMEYVLASLSKQSIESLIVKLKRIERDDCLLIIAPYLKGEKGDIDKITKELENLQVERCERRKKPSTGDESTSSGVPVSDDQRGNPYVMTITAAEAPDRARQSWE